MDCAEDEIRSLVELNGSNSSDGDELIICKEDHELGASPATCKYSILTRKSKLQMDRFDVHKIGRS